MPRLFIEWEYLYNELMKYGEQHLELGITDSTMEGIFGDKSNPS